MVVSQHILERSNVYGILPDAVLDNKELHRGVDGSQEFFFSQIENVCHPRIPQFWTT
jgi:hypothetical protein